jgi:hypothetical protein
MYLHVRVQWPNILGDFESMGEGWKTDMRFDPSVRIKMLVQCELAVQDLRKATQISSSISLYGICKFHLKFEVERTLVHYKVLMDENLGAVLHVVVKEQKKDEDTTDHVISVVRVSSSRTGRLDVGKMGKRSHPVYHYSDTTTYSSGNGLSDYGRLDNMEEMDEA